MTDVDISQDYMHLLTRIPGSFFAGQSAEPRPRYDKVIDLLLIQPPEIRQMILNWLEPSDLLKLRATSHSLHTLIHDSERAICVALSEHISKTYSLSHLPIPVNDLSSFFTMSRLHRAIESVSDVIASRICGVMILRPPSTREEVLKSVCSRTLSLLKTRLTRSFIILQYYLAFVFKTMLENEEYLLSLDDESFSGLFNIFDLDQQHFLTNNMSNLTEADFIDVTASWNIFKSVCKARHLVLSSRIFTFCSVSVKHMFMYDGFTPFASLLDTDVTPPMQQAILRSNDERRRCQNLIKEVDLLPTIRHLDVRKQTLKMDFQRRRSSKAREAYINHQDIWDRASRALMMQKLGRYPDVKTPSEWLRGLLYSIENGREVEIGNWTVGN